MLDFTDAEPKYLVAVQPIPTNDVKKLCKGSMQHIYIYIYIKKNMYWQWIKNRNSPRQGIFSGKYATDVLLNQWEPLETFS